MSRVLLALALAAALLAAGVYGAAGAVGIADSGGSLDGVFHLRYETDQSPDENAGERLAGLNCTYALVREQSRLAEAPLFSRSRAVTQLTVEGDASLLFASGKLLSGYFPDDRRHCVIDADSARQLWGSIEVLEQVVEMGGERFAVCGVVDSPAPLVLLAAEADPTFAYRSAVCAVFPDEVFPRQVVDSFVLELGGSGSPFLSEPARTTALLRFASRMPLLLGWLLLTAFGLSLFRVPGRTLPRLCLLASAVIAWAGLGIQSFLRPDMLPTRWSEFAFWQRQLETVWEQIRTAWLLPGSVYDYTLFADRTLPVVCLCALTVAAFLLAYRVLKCRTLRRFYGAFRLRPTAKPAEATADSGGVEVPEPPSTRDVQT